MRVPVAVERGPGGLWARQPPQSPAEQTYQRYQEWLAFHHRRRTFIDRVTVALGYPPATAS
jgi:hypothetical protein